MSDKSTPRPWRVIDSGNGEWFDVYDEDDNLIVGTGTIFTSKANAELICRAVNQYDHVAELVSSLRELKELLKHGGEYSISRIDGNPMGLGEVIPIGEIFLRADAALAKMEVGQ